MGCVCYLQFIELQLANFGNMNPKLKRALLDAESVAHLQGKEWYILPLADTARLMYQLLIDNGIDVDKAIEESDIRFE